MIKSNHGQDNQSTTKMNKHTKMRVIEVVVTIYKNIAIIISILIMNKVQSIYKSHFIKNRNSKLQIMINQSIILMI